MARPAGANAATDAIRDTRRESLNMLDVCDDASQLRSVIAVRVNLSCIGLRSSLLSLGKKVKCIA